MKRASVIAICAVLVLVALAAGVFIGQRRPVSDSIATESRVLKTVGSPLTKDEISRLVSFFSEEPLAGGQKSPRFSKWVNDRTFAFVQFDNQNPAQATTLRLIGLGVKGVFCKENQPSTNFIHFHRLNAPEYALGHGGNAGDEGYWLLSVATDELEFGDRTLKPGALNAFPPTPPPSCPTTG
jgi:hypothetical protein